MICTYLELIFLQLTSFFTIIIYIVQCTLHRSTLIFIFCNTCLCFLCIIIFFVFCVHYLMLFCFCVEEIICVLCALYNIIFVCALCLRHDICFVCYADPGSSHAQAISAVGLFHRPISDKICKRNIVIISSFF